MLATSAAQAAQSGGFPSLSPAAQVLIAALPLVAVVLLAVLAFFSMLWDHQRNTIIVARGEKPVPRDIDDKILLLGVVALFVGIGLLVFFALHDGITNSLLGGIIPVAAGLGTITHYAVSRRRKNG